MDSLLHLGPLLLRHRLLLLLQRRAHRAPKSSSTALKRLKKSLKSSTRSLSNTLFHPFSIVFTCVYAVFTLFSLLFYWFSKCFFHLFEGLQQRHVLPGPLGLTRDGLREAVEDGHGAALPLQHGLKGLEKKDLKWIFKWI